MTLNRQSAAISPSHFVTSDAREDALLLLGSVTLFHLRAGISVERGYRANRAFPVYLAVLFWVGGTLNTTKSALAEHVWSDPWTVGVAVIACWWLVRDRGTYPTRWY